MFDERKIEEGDETVTKNVITSNSWFTCLAIGCLSLVSLAIAATIIVALIPLYLPKKTIDVDFTPQINTLTYELPSSIEVAFGRTGGSQMALIKGGSLDAKQLTMIRTIIQEKLNGDRKTKKMQITIMNNSTIQTGANCKITSVQKRRVRRQTTIISDPNEIIHVNQQKHGSESYTTFKISCTFSCTTSCSNSLINHAIDVTLAQLQFTGSSLIDLFYSGSSASITGGSSAILLPVVDPSIDTKSLDNLRASKSQSLHYEQILDRSVPINSYAATVNFEFEIPSIVFDHSSLIYIYNMTNETIVFGFGNADAFAQTLGWPETGIAMIIKGECLSENANDVFMLNGFIYDTNLLTVAANFTQSEIANVSTNVSVTFGPSNNATTNTTTNSTISGDPQPYSPDVEYVNPLFFSNKTVNLDNAYYANLNGSNDSATDDEAGCYYNSFSQALLYDIVDGRNYDDKTAYNKLANSVAAKGYGRQNISDIDANPVAQNATSSDQASPTIIESFSAKQNAKFDEVFKLARERLSNNRTGMSTLSRRRRRHQHRRNIGMSIASKNLVRHKRFWGFLEDAVNAVADVFTPVVDTVVDAVKPVIDTVTEVGKVVATAIFGGVYEKNAQININIGYDNPVQIYRIEDLRIMCMECNIKGTVDIHGRFDFGKDGIETVMNEGYVETTGKIVAKAVGGLVGAVTIKKGIEVATIPLTNINIPGVFTLGPQIVLEVGVSVKIGEDLNATFGAYVTWERIYTKIDMKHPDKSQSTGWDPDHVEPKFSFSSEAVVEVGVYVEPRIELTLEAFGGIIEATAGLAATGTLGASAEYDESSEDCPGGVQLGAFVSIELSVFAEFGIIDFKLVNEEYSIFEHSIPISSIYCIGALSQTTPPQITSESTTSTPAIDVKFTTTASPTIGVSTTTTSPTLGVSTTTTSPTLGVSTTTTSPTDSKSTTTTPPSNGESTTNTPPTDGKSTTTTSLTTIPQAEFTTITTSISISTTTLQACIICCDSENNGLPCGSSCTCNGPHMRDDGAGIVGHFTCWQGDPPVQKRFYSRLCFPTTSIEPTTTAPSIDATTSISTAIVPAESTAVTTSINIPTTTLQACIICCDSENNGRPCGSSCTCNGPHMRDDGAGIVGRFTCWQGDPPVQKRFYSRLCFPTTTAITATSTITDISITTQPNTEIPDISSDNTHEFTHQSTSTTNTNTVTAETSTSIMTSIIVSSATTTLENNPETTAEPTSQSSSTLIIEHTTINDLVETTTSTRINPVISEEVTSPTNPEVTTTYTATSETTEQLTTLVTSSITTDESTTIPQETEKTTKEATSGEISDESSSSTHTESSTEYTTTLEATETITRSVTNTIITHQSVSSTNIESTTISDSAEIITKEKTSAGISDQSASSTHTKSTVQDATTPVVTNTEISNKPTSATHTESTVQDTTTAEATEIITRAVTNAEASDEPTSPIHIKSSMDYIRTTEGTEIITTTVTNAISTDERISPAYTESTVQDSTTAETTEIITRAVTTVGLSDESTSVTHAESTIQDITTAETTEIITRSVTTVGLSDESTSVTHAESTIQDTTTAETTEIITRAVTTVGLDDESTVQETTIAETTESITRAVTSAEISDELSTETHTEPITTAMMITTTEYNSVITSLSTVDDRTEGHTDTQLVTTVDDITVVTEVPLSTCDMCCDAANTNRTCSSSNCRCDGSDYTGGSGTANAYYHCLEGDPPHSEPYILFGCGPPATT